MTIESGLAYVNDILEQIGRKTLAEDGVTDPTVEDATARGKELLSTWIAVNEPEIDPQYGLKLVELQPEYVDTAVSFPRQRQRQGGRPGAGGRGPGGVRARACPSRSAAADAVADPVSSPAELLAVMRQLRVECDWKRAQTHRSLARYLLEETHETLEAIDTGDADHLREELGDLLLQVYFHAVIAEENGDFTFEDVAADIVAKLRRRNPHVFGSAAGLRTGRGQRAVGVDQGRREAARLRHRRAPSRPAGAAVRRQGALPARPVLAGDPVPPADSDDPPTTHSVSATGSWPWSPRRARTASTPSRRSATPCAAPSTGTTPSRRGPVRAPRRGSRPRDRDRDRATRPARRSAGPPRRPAGRSR